MLPALRRPAPPRCSPTLTTDTLHHASTLISWGVVGRYSLATALLTRHSSFLPLQLFMIWMYSLRPMPVTRRASAACGWAGAGQELRREQVGTV